MALENITYTETEVFKEDSLEHRRKIMDIYNKGPLWERLQKAKSKKDNKSYNRETPCL